MPGYLDVSLRFVDPLDDFRLFDAVADQRALVEAYTRLAPRGLGGPGEPAGQCVLAPPTYYQTAAGVEAMRAVNDFVLGQARARPEIAAAFGVVEPKYEGHAEPELERLAAQGVKGVVWSGRAQGVFVNDALMLSLCAKAHDLGLLSMYLTAPYSSNEALWRILALARRCPDVPVIVSGAMQGYDNAQHVASMLDDPGNVYFDTASWSGSSGFIQFAGRLAEKERLVFGTGGSAPVDQAAGKLRGALAAAGLSEGRIEGVMHRTARKLLGLAENRA